MTACAAGTSAYRSYDSNRLRPHRYGQHTSSISPFKQSSADELSAPGETKSSTKDGEILCEYLQVCVDIVSAILLARSRGIGSVGTAGIFLLVGIGRGAFVVCRQSVVLAQFGLNLVNHAQIADVFAAARISKMRLAIGAAINVDRRKIGDLGLFPV